MTTRRKHLIAGGVMLIAALFAAGCSKSRRPTETTIDGETSTAPSSATAKHEQKALFRFVNGMQSPKDLYFQDMPAFTKVAFGEITPYSALPTPRGDARHDLKLYNSSSNVGTPLASNFQGENIGLHYTVLAINRDGKPSLKVIQDQLKPPTPGKTKLRLIHAAPGVDKLDVYRVGEAQGIFSGQSFAQVTEYKEIAPATTELAVRKRGSKIDEVDVKDVKLEAGKLYTIILLGGEGKPLSCKVIEDELLPPVSPITSKN